MARGVLVGAAIVGAVAALAGAWGLAGTSLSHVLLACGVLTALSLSRAPRRD